MPADCSGVPSGRGYPDVRSVRDSEVDDDRHGDVGQMLPRGVGPRNVPMVSSQRRGAVHR